MRFSRSVNLFAWTGGDERRAGARLGALLVIVGVMVSIPTFPTTPMRPHTRMLTLVVLTGRPIVAMAAQWLPWERWDRRWLLAWPVFTTVGVAMASRVSFTGGAPALSGLLVTAFFFVGMTQDRGMSFALLPVAIPAWIATQGGWSTHLVARMTAPTRYGSSSVRRWRSCVRRCGP